MKMLAMIVMFSTMLGAGVYDYGYHPLRDVAINDQNNSLFYGKFERIIRYDPILYSPSDPISIDAKFREYVEKIHQSIEAYTAAGVPYQVTLVAHTSAHEGESQAVCNRVLDAAKKQLTDNKVDEKNIMLECRASKDPIFLENDGNARELNYYLLVTLYQ
jgi:hypothetical protein